MSRDFRPQIVRLARWWLAALDRAKRRRSSYVESPQGEIAAQIAEMRGRGSDLVRNAS